MTSCDRFAVTPTGAVGATKGADIASDGEVCGKGDVITRYDVMLLGQWVHCSDRKASDKCKVTSYCTDVMLQVAVAPTGAMWLHQEMRTLQ